MANSYIGPRTTQYNIFSYWKGKGITKDGRIVNKGVCNSYSPVREDALPRCFACGCFVDLSDSRYKNEKKMWNSKETKQQLKRHLILPNALNGEDKAQNIFLLCPHCHSYAPATTNPKLFFGWCYQKQAHPSFIGNTIADIQIAAKNIFGISEKDINNILRWYSLNEKEILEYCSQNSSLHGKEAMSTSFGYLIAEYYHKFLTA